MAHIEMQLLLEKLGYELEVMRTEASPDMVVFKPLISKPV